MRFAAHQIFCLAQVFPKLYLPLMTEGNARSLRPWRMYLPTPSWFRYRSRLAQLDAYVIQILRDRWDSRQQSSSRRADLLEKRLDVIIVSTSDYASVLSLLQSSKGSREHCSAWHAQDDVLWELKRHNWAVCKLHAM